jgi:aprataxin
MALQQDQLEPLLKEDLVCWRCHETFKTLPKLKEHLTWEKEAEASRKKDARQAEKGKSPGDGDVDEANPARGEPSSKRQAVTPNVNT